MGYFNKTKYFILVIMIFSSGCFFRMGRAPFWDLSKTLNEILNFEKNQKLLVINCDDIGMHPTITDGAIEVMKSGLVKSASIIANDRNDKELERIALIVKENPQWGFGIHLFLSNEYQEDFPWSPVLTKKEVPTLYNEKGLAWKTRKEALCKVDPEEAEKEWEAQILKAKKYGISLSHIDCHQGVYYFESKYPGSDPKGLTKAAVRLAEKYKLPLVMNTYDRKLKKIIKQMDQKKIIRPDMFVGMYDLGRINKFLAYKGNIIQRKIVASIMKMKYGLILPFKDKFSVEEDMKQRKKIYYAIISHEVKPGINHLFMHASVDKAFDGSSISDWSKRRNGLDGIIRLSEMEIWSGAEMRSFIEKHNIKTISYKKLQELQGKI